MFPYQTLCTTGRCRVFVRAQVCAPGMGTSLLPPPPSPPGIVGSALAYHDKKAAVNTEFVCENCNRAKVRWYNTKREMCILPGEAMYC